MARRKLPLAHFAYMATGVDDDRTLHANREGRRGTDIFKALALGARAVCIGRPYVWGLAAFGQPGVEAVLDILRRELTTIMRQTGTVKLSEIRRQSVVDRGR
ncbi:MAG TPA: alpha-hydroxy-acid oxidizing protein [Acidimicrobiales bacterium]|nr:alpha-hydroxy-acid oxidizing protein [Acidimicrobiales bacterium]